MPLSTAAKAVLCVCPPALLAGTVATVPSVRRAVHHATAHRATPKAVRRAGADKPAVAQTVARQQVECEPGFAGMPPAAPLLTYAAPIADEPAGTDAIPQSGGYVPTIAGIGIGTPGGTPVVPGGPGGGGGGTGTTPTTPVTPVTPEPTPGPVPEPSTWLMLIGGVGLLGAGLRRRRNGLAAGGSSGTVTVRKVSFGGMLLSSSAAVEAGDMAATVVVKSALASAAGKALLCVCPAAVVAGSVMTVAPLRQAVHAYTAPDASPAAIRDIPGMAPCIEPILPQAATPLATAAAAPMPAPTAISTLGEAAPAAPATPTDKTA